MPPSRKFIYLRDCSHFGQNYESIGAKYLDDHILSYKKQKKTNHDAMAS